jgi:hypothetical protein
LNKGCGTQKKKKRPSILPIAVKIRDVGTMTTVIHIPPITSSSLARSQSIRVQQYRPILLSQHSYNWWYSQGRHGKMFAINPNVYTLLVSGIPLALKAICKMATNLSFSHPSPLAQLALLHSTSVLPLILLRSSFK